MLRANRSISANVARSTRSYASSSSKPARPIRRFIITTTLLAGAFYGGSSYYALQDPAYAEFFTATFPGAHQVLETIEDAHLKDRIDNIDYDAIRNHAQRATEVSKDAYARLHSLVDKYANAGKVTEKAAQAKDAVKDEADEGLYVGSGLVNKAKDVMNDTVDKAKDGVEKGVETASEKATTVAHKAEETLEHVGSKAEKAGEKVSEAIEDPNAGGLTADGKKIYTGPPLPIGHSLPDGYVYPPKPAAPAAAPKPKKEKKVEPLPLLAPAVKDLSASEPIVSQLAETIDSLSKFLQDTPHAAGSVKQVISTAEGDLSALGQRLEALKEEEKKKLEKSLDSQAKEYSIRLAEHERQIQNRVTSHEQDWREQFDAERKSIAESFKRKLSDELATQSEIINQRLREQVVAQGVEMQRRWLRDIKLKVEQERGGRLAKLESLADDVKNLERITYDNADYVDDNVRVHTLWSTYRALERAIIGKLSLTEASDEKKPFRKELDALVKIAKETKEDTAGGQVVEAALESLTQSKIPDQGVESVSDLSDWYRQSIEPKVRRVALAPEVGAGPLSIAVSSVLSSLLLFKKQGLVEGTDVAAVLSRADYYLSQKNLDMAARELNQLTGWPKTLLTDWLNEARKTLHVQQALDVVETEATLASLLVI
ncbi:hypothetical protein E3P99_01989 [Wallemia hederae]|uniref:MICOS complex subunit MIC60 n=1 Tax=Wallemia hederae TaxID=1540922 RepID=A0A4T0FM62_9BASI|nr:hypothetical protein E3P99_01989 [Wallemia hederae]